MTIEQRYTKNDKCKQNVCLASIQRARDSRQMRVLAAYIYFKQHFHKSILYNYRSRSKELAGVLQVSPRTLHTYIQAWMRWGLVRRHNNHLVLIATAKIKRAYRERRKYQITILIGENIDTIEARLNAKLLEEHAGAMNFYRRITRYLRKKQAPSRSNDTKKTDCDESLPGTPAFSLSLRNIAKVLNVSHPKAKQNVLMLNDLGVITTTKTKPRPVAKAPASSLRSTDGLAGHFFRVNGMVFQVFGSRHTFNEHSPPAQDFTYRQFICAYRNSGATLRRTIDYIHAHNVTKNAILPC